LKHQASIILASASPRRKQLLTQAGYKFTVVPADIDENAISAEGISSAEYTQRLALAKAEKVAQQFPNSLVIGSDTIVDFEGEIIGKAVDEKHAEEITRKLFSKPHKVITGIAIVRLSNNTRIVESDTTVVYPKKMNDKQIARHIEGGNWRDKAGAYAIQETGDEFVERIDGSLTNVMGFPMELVGRLLETVTSRPIN
jgi:septum formation protein